MDYNFTRSLWVLIVWSCSLIKIKGMLGAFWDATSNSFGLFVFVTAQYVVGQQDTKDKYESCVPQIQIGFWKEILVEKRFTNSVRQEAS